MDIVATGPLSVASFTFQPSTGGYAFVVLGKVTYQLAPFAATVAPEQEPVVWTDVPWDGKAGASIRAPGDVVPFRARAEVTLVGSAYAPGGQPVRSLVARLDVGDGAINKAIEVHADRAFAPDGSIEEGAPFTRMPLRYEHAAFGPKNPVGVRAARDAGGRIPLPNLLPRGARVAQPRDPIDPVGFGPLHAAWPERAAKLPQGAAWTLHEHGSRPLPGWLAPAFFNAAPADQQLDALPEDAIIALENLHPKHPHFNTTLPGARPRAIVEATSEELPMRAEALWIDTDRGICTLTFRGQLALAHPQTPGRVVVELVGRPSRRGRAAAWSDPATTAPHPSNAGETLTGVMNPGAAPLPFATPDRSPASGASAPPAQASPAAAALPFAAPTSAKAPRPPAPPPPEERDQTLNLRMQYPDKPVPASAPPSAPPNPPAAPEAAPKPPAWVRPSDPPSPAAPAWKPSPWSTPGRDGTAAAAPASASPSPAPSTPAAGPLRPGPGSAAAASDAAAKSDAPGTRGEQRAKAPSPEARPAARPRAAAHERVEVLWHERGLGARLRLLDALRDVFAEPGGARGWLKPDEVSRESEEARERRDMSRALGRAAAIDAEGLEDALAEAFDDDGSYAPPLVVVSGELSVCYDELLVLKATLGVVGPLIGPDKRLRETVEASAAVLGAEPRPPAEALEGATVRVREAFASGSRAVPPSYLSTTVERMMLEGRSYQRRMLLGQTRLRALLAMPGARSALPVYLPEALANDLPLFQRFPAKLVAELRPQQDELDPPPHALIALALGRVLPASPGRRA
jgi:hypothetical protein